MYIEVIINENVKQLNRTFDYKVPDKFKDNIFIGTRVLVPLKGREADGFVVGIKDKSKFECLDIIDVLAEQKIDKVRSDLALFMSRRYFCNVSECIKLMLNPEVRTKKEKNILKEKKITVYYVNQDLLDKTREKENAELILSLTDKQGLVLNHILEDIKQKKEIEKTDIDKKDKVILDNNNNNNNNNNDEIIYYTSNELQEKFLTSTYMIQKLQQLNILKKTEIVERTHDELEEIEDYNEDLPEDKKILNPEQLLAYNEIISGLNKDKFSEYLIYGVTGSGKTEIYLQVIDKVLEKGKTVIVLVPEISLTPQMERRFENRFPGEIAVLHSKRGRRERFDEWKDIEEGRKRIVIGTRSAIFAPLKNLGMIIIDEEHDSSYKSGMTPRYDAKEVARFLAKKYKAIVVSGSATPLVESMYRAKNDESKLLTLTKRATNTNLPDVEVIDMRTEEDIFSKKAKLELLKNIENKKQSLIFLNRRGFSSTLICNQCGHIETCPHCSINLTYHKAGRVYKCHYCGYKKGYSGRCLDCLSDKLKFLGTGTQKVQEKLKELNPNISIIRMDQDTTSNKGGHEKILSTFQKEKIDVMVGTQMIAKGHHFPNVTLVEIFSADSLINQENFRASETAFQTIVQVIGRAGREEKGRAFIQTYNPEHYVVELAKDSNYPGFYETELSIREKLNYPPFSDIIELKIVSENEYNAINIANKLENTLRQNLNSLYKLMEKEVSLRNKSKNIDDENKIEKVKEEIENIEIMQAQPYRISKINNRYRWRIIIKANLSNSLAFWIKRIVESIKLDKESQIYVDLNPFDG